MNSFCQNFLVTAIQRGLKFKFTPGHYYVMTKCELLVLRLYKIWGLNFKLLCPHCNRKLLKYKLQLTVKSCTTVHLYLLNYACKFINKILFKLKRFFLKKINFEKDSRWQQKCEKIPSMQIFRWISLILTETQNCGWGWQQIQRFHCDLQQTFNFEWITLFLPDIHVDWETHNEVEGDNKLTDLVVTYS